LEAVANKTFLQKSLAQVDVIEDLFAVVNPPQNLEVIPEVTPA
jgi:hypothetical protein